VAPEKIAVLRATAPPPGGGPGPAASSAASGIVDKAAIVRRSAARLDDFAGRAARFFMANIHSQKKRILRGQRERLENRNYTSAIKTYLHRLQDAVTNGDQRAANAEHARLQSTVDKAVKRGALHRNAGAHKKARAARIRAGASS
jgi:small subunit ribosomal protein S20